MLPGTTRWLKHTVQYYAPTGYDENGNVTYASTPTSYSCHIQSEEVKELTNEGLQVITRPVLLFDGDVDISVKGKIVMPGGETFIIKSVNGIYGLDGTTYAVEVKG